MKKKVSSKHLFWVENGIFPGCVMVSCGFTMPEVKKYLIKKKAEHWYIAYNDLVVKPGVWGMGMSRKITNKKSGKEVTCLYIHIKDKFDFSDFSMIALAHEVLHICQFFLPDALDREKEHEAEAYYHSHLMGKILHQLRS